MRKPQYIIYTWAREVSQGLAMCSLLLEYPSRAATHAQHPCKAAHITYIYEIFRDKFTKNNME